MRRLGLGVLLVLAGCGNGYAPQAPAVEEAAREAAPDGLSMRGIDLRVYRADPTHGTARKPAFHVHAEQFDVIEEKVYAFQDARAVIFGAAPEDEDIVFEARQGRYEEEKSAYLKDGVHTVAGTTSLALQDVWCDIAEDGRVAVARSDFPVRIEDPALHLESSSLRLYPDDKRIELTDVKGVIDFERIQP